MRMKKMRVRTRTRMTRMADFDQTKVKSNACSARYSLYILKQNPATMDSVVSRLYLFSIYAFWYSYGEALDLLDNAGGMAVS